jgi:hypothetical protein
MLKPIEKNKIVKGMVLEFIQILNRMVQEGLTEKIVFEQRPEGLREPAIGTDVGRGRSKCRL